MSKKLISVVTPCFNEEDNIVLMIDKIRSIFTAYEHRYDLEIIVIDNASEDQSVRLVRQECERDKRVKLIVNSRNFGWIRSPYHGLLQAQGDAVIYLASDFQDPPDLIPEFLERWEKGYKIAIGVKSQSEETFLMFKVRSFYYNLIDRISNNKLFKNFTGFGLYDKRIIEILRKIDDPYPYFRGLVSEVGFEKAIITYTQPTRKRGFSKGNFYALYDVAMIGITSYSKIPLRMATMLGFGMSAVSLIVAVVYLILKLIFWFNYPTGMASMIIGIFFLSSVQLFFIGILGEYIGSIHTMVQKRPLVIELERVNFEDSEADPK